MSHGIRITRTSGAVEDYSADADESFETSPRADGSLTIYKVVQQSASELERREYFLSFGPDEWATIEEH